MERLQELQRNFDTYLNGKEKTPSGLKKAIEEITERVLKENAPTFSWNKCEADQEIEFSGYFNLGDIEKIEIAADYSGETVNVYINVNDEELEKEKTYNFYVKEIYEETEIGICFAENEMDTTSTEEGIRKMLRKNDIEVGITEWNGDFRNYIENASIEEIIKQNYLFYKETDDTIAEIHIVFVEE